MNLLLDQKRTVAAWALQHLRMPRYSGLADPFSEPYEAFGVLRQGELSGVVIFSGQTVDGEISITVVGAGWTRSLFRWVGDYVFNQLGCVRLSAIVADPIVANYCVRLGFVREGVKRRYYGDVDGIMLGMLKEECKWLKRAAVAT